MNPTAALARTLAIAIAFLVTAPGAADVNRPPSSADAVLAAVPKATWIVEGQGRRVVYVFFDPNCPSCHLLNGNLRTFIASHDLQLRWIPVAAVNATSLGKAAAILEAPNPPAALRRNEEAYDTQHHAGGIEEQLPSVETEQRLRANERLLNRPDIPVVANKVSQVIPFSLTCDRSVLTVIPRLASFDQITGVTTWTPLQVPGIEKFSEWLNVTTWS